MNVYVSIFETTLSKREQSALALKLLDRALTREFSRSLLEFEIVRAEHGKPYFKDSGIFFSYSHCMNAVACAVSESEVGVDVEKVREVSTKLMRRVCHENELKLIKTADDFIKIWTVKEAYAKFTGEGFSRGFRSVDTTALNAGCVKIGEFYVACCNGTQILTNAVFV